MTTVVFDFDGTIALGSGPVVAFANALSEQTAGPDVVSASLLALEEFESGESEDRDGYAAVTRAAAAGGLSSMDVNAAYLRSRQHLGTKLSPIELPDGLACFLERLAPVADVWLATNAPAVGIAHVLESGGVHHSFARTHFNVGKPNGLTPILADALSSGPVLSVGDIYDYDLAPAVALGAETALVGETSSRDPHSVTMRAARLEDLYPQIQTWAVAASSIAVRRPEVPSPTTKEK